MTPAEKQRIEQDDLQAAIETKRELGEGYDDEIVASLMKKLDDAIEDRVRSEVAKEIKASDKVDKTLIAQLAISLGTAIPLVAIAGSIGGALGIAAVCTIILATNLTIAIMRR